MGESRDIELLEGYLQDALSGDLKKEVRTRLDRDDDFRALFDDLYLMQMAIRQLDPNNTKEELLDRLRDVPIDQFFEEEEEEEEEEDLEEEDDNDHVPADNVIDLPRRSQWFYLKWSSAAALLLLLGAIYWMNLTGDGQQNLFVIEQEYFQKSPVIGFSITRSVSQADLRMQAYSAYQSHLDEKADSLFGTLLPISQNKSLDLYHAGNVSLQLRKWDDAIDAFEEVLKLGDQLTEASTWYLALAHLGKGNKADALKLLSDLKEEKIYQSRTEEIIKKIK